ncbi:MAG TPA: pilus assembly protein TadG-related protein [Pyrinomonadaceae bacterium]|nr:pilus assembly protein TadG-related protein [Pyrinomonadaceae bacterium]
MRSRAKSEGRGGERGSVLAVSAFGMLAFLLAVGLCVDISQFYVVQAELQNAADAAALAGASALNSQPGGINEAVSRATSVMNNYEFNQTGVTIEDKHVTFAVNFDGPYVDAGTAAGAGVAKNVRFVQVQVPPKPVGVFFASLAMGGLDTANISAEAVAGMSVPPNVFCDWIPLAVIDDPDHPTLIKGQEYIIRGGPHTMASAGNRQVLAVGGTGASVVRENIARGIRECAKPGDIYTKDTKPGVNAGPVQDGLNTRFGDYAAGMDWHDFPPDQNVKEGISFTDYDTAKPDDPEMWESPGGGMVGEKHRRVIVLPVIALEEFNEGRDTVHFWKFVAFFLKRRIGSGSGGDIVAEYIEERTVFGTGGYIPGGGPVTPELASPVLYR